MIRCRSTPVLLLLAIASLAVGCKTIPLKPEAKPVRLVFTEDKVNNCVFIGDVMGSEGHWYTYLFLNNDVMTQAALNDLRNRAHALGANTVFIPRLVNLFVTSVTIFGEAFHCEEKQDGAK